METQQTTTSPTASSRSGAREWQEMDVYEYSDTSATDYVIDTPPPPYPTGNLHRARPGVGVHRLRRPVPPPAGRGRPLPQVGLSRPADRGQGRGEPRHPPDGRPRDEFREHVEHTEDQIDSMKETMLDLGFGIDWSAEYRTMDEEYWGRPSARSWRWPTQTWCTATNTPSTGVRGGETAIADAEVETEEGVDGTLYYVTFPGVDNDDIEIATTRPELLAACVSMAVDPGDERYADRVGDTFEVPLFGQEVELIADDDVDGDFWTGAVMICTFGDKQDVDWWAEHDLDLRPVFTEDGHPDELAGEFEGLSIAEAKTEVAEALDDEGVPERQRAHDPERRAVLALRHAHRDSLEGAVVRRGRPGPHPGESSGGRVDPRAHVRPPGGGPEGMDWDWVISRQRVFATPIPAWHCSDCGHWHIATQDDLPVDPTDEGPAVGECPEMRRQRLAR